MYLTRNQAGVYSASGVRIPPSPPDKAKGRPSGGLLLCPVEGRQMRSPAGFDGSAGAEPDSRRLAPQRAAHSAQGLGAGMHPAIPPSPPDKAKGRPSGGLLLCPVEGRQMRSPVGVRRFCRSRTGQPQAGPAAHSAQGLGAWMHPAIPPSPPDKAKGRPSGGLLLCPVEGRQMRSPAGVRRFCRSRTGQPQAGPQRGSAGRWPAMPGSAGAIIPACFQGMFT